jgi:hypothetical protein
MGVIASWLNDRYQTKEVNLIVEDTHAQLKTADELMNMYYPIKEYDDRNFLGLIVDKIRPIASVIGYNGKAPSSRQGRLRQAVSQLIKIGLDTHFDEEDQFRMEEALRYARLANSTLQDRVLPDGKLVTGTANSLADYIFQRPEDLVVGIHNMLRLFSWQIATTGMIDHTDPRTNIRTQLSWLDPDANYTNFPSPLTNTGSGHPLGSVIWTDVENADGIATMENALLEYYDTNGFFPDEIAMSLDLIVKLSRQQKVIDRAKGYNLFTNGTSVGLNVITNIMDNVLQTKVKISAYDLRYDLEDINGDSTTARFLPTNRIVMFKKGVGERALGTTIESKTGLYDAPKKGIYVNTVNDPLDDTHDIMKARATGLAIALNPKVLYSLQVAA